MSTSGLVSIFKVRAPANPEDRKANMPVDYEHPAGDMNNYVFGNGLGSGAYAKVMLAKVRSTGAKVGITNHCGHVS